MGVTVVIPPAVDAQPIGVEAADADAMAARVHARSADIDVLKQAFTSVLVVADDRINHDPGTWRFVVLAEQCLLFTPVFGR